MIERSLRHRRFARGLLDAMGLSSLAAIALAAPACGGNVIVDGSSGTAGAGGAGGSTSSSSSSSSSSASSTSSSTGGVDCDGIGGATGFTCLGGSGTSCPALDAAEVHQQLAAQLGLCDAVQDTWTCCDLPSLIAVVCGPDQSLIAEACCYHYAVDPQLLCGVGRPFVVEGAPRTGDVRPRADWIAEGRPRADDLDATTRRALAEAWSREARFEHASVASFARLALELLAAGAPADLVRDAQRAMGDEIRHAELCFALASAYAGAPVGPGPIAVDGALGRVSLADIAAAAVREGCIGETIAALTAMEGRDAATDPAVRAALTVIAEDEGEHAAMSWRLVAWAYRSGDHEVRAAVAAAFATGVAAPRDEAPAGIDPRAYRAHGRPLPEEVRAIAASALANVIRPSARALLGSIVEDRVTTGAG